MRRVVLAGKLLGYVRRVEGSSNQEDTLEGGGYETFHMKLSQMLVSKPTNGRTD
jgi:hypothetical protein